MGTRLALHVPFPLVVGQQNSRLVAMTVANESACTSCTVRLVLICFNAVNFSSAQNLKPNGVLARLHVSHACEKTQLLSTHLRSKPRNVIYSLCN